MLNNQTDACANFPVAPLNGHNKSLVYCFFSSILLDLWLPSGV
jgi:hypothetical protein